MQNEGPHCTKYLYINRLDHFPSSQFFYFIFSVHIAQTYIISSLESLTSAFYRALKENEYLDVFQ